MVNHQELTSNSPQDRQHNQHLIDALSSFPSEWQLTPVKNKKPLRDQWELEPPLTREKLAAVLRDGQSLWSKSKQETWHCSWTGVGLRLGPISGGALAIDFDGTSAFNKLMELSGGEPLPVTVVWTSGKPGRSQHLFRIPKLYWERLRDRRVISTGVKGEQLEFRWNNHQSVLPPSLHPDTDRYKWIQSPTEYEVAEAPAWLIECLLKESPSAQLNVADPTLPDVSTRFALPSESSPKHCEKLNDTDWVRNCLSALHPGRADEYHTWLEVGMALHSVADHLLADWDQWSQQSSKYKPGECERKWKSFKKSGVGLGTLVHLAKQDGWQSPLILPYSAEQTGDRCSVKPLERHSYDVEDKADYPSLLTPFITAPNLIQLQQEIRTATSRDLSPLDLKTFKLNLRARYSQVSSRDIDQLFDLLKQEAEKEELNEDHRQDVNNLLTLEDQSLSLDDYLPPTLANPLNRLAVWMNIRPEVCLLALLAAVSSLHKVGTELVIRQAQGFTVPPNLFAAIVAPSGQRKSPVLKVIVNRPLGVLQRVARERYQRAVVQFESDCEEWNQLKGEARESRFPAGKPQKPRQELYYVTDVSGEGLFYQFSAHPHRSILLLKDELAGVFKSENKYRGGRGSDREDLLSAFDGTGATVLRAEGAKSDIDGLLLSIFGTIQPDILKRFMSDCSDPDGQWSRFLFVTQPLAAATLPDDDCEIDLKRLLSEIYCKIDQLPAIKYRLSRQAFKRYQSIFNKLEQLRVEHPEPGIRAVYSKQEGYIGRLALNLHVLHELASGHLPSDEIPLDRVKQAIALSKFFIGQALLVHAASATARNSLAPRLVKLINVSRQIASVAPDQEGWIKARNIQLAYDAKHRPQPDEVRSWMRELANLGYGKIRGEGVRLEFCAFL